MLVKASKAGRRVWLVQANPAEPIGSKADMPCWDPPLTVGGRVLPAKAHVSYARRSAHASRQRDRLVRSYQGYRPGVLVLAACGRQLGTPQRAWGCRRVDTARQRLQRESLRQGEVRPRVTFGKAAATAGGVDWRASQSSGCVGDPWAEHAVGSGAGTLLTLESWHGTDWPPSRCDRSLRRGGRHFFHLKRHPS